MGMVGLVEPPRLFCIFDQTTVVISEPCKCPGGSAGGAVQMSCVNMRGVLSDLRQLRAVTGMWKCGGIHRKPCAAGSMCCACARWVLPAPAHMALQAVPQVHSEFLHPFLLHGEGQARFVFSGQCVKCS